MTSRSKLAILAALLGAALAGCGSGGDVSASTAANTHPSTPTDQLPQQGAGGRKAAAGGGEADFGIVPAKPGEETGPLVGGRK